jgi:hypothetical protein
MILKAEKWQITKGKLQQSHKVLKLKYWRFYLGRRQKIQRIANTSVTQWLSCHRYSPTPAPKPNGGIMDWNRLIGSICGDVILQSDSNYSAQRDELMWNGLKSDGRPSAIVQVANEGDVCEAILFARANGLKVVARGGGHNWQGAQVRGEGALVIDLSRLNRVHIDVANRKAIIEPVVTNAQTVAALGKKRLAFPVGDCPTVSASGYLLGGGMGINTQNWGSGCQQVEAVHFVNAKGECQVADATHNSDLYWAARGGAQGFPGVITRYHLKVHPLPNAIRASAFVYRLDEAQEFADWLSELQKEQRLDQTVYQNTLITSTWWAKILHDMVNGLPSCLPQILHDLLPSSGCSAKRKAYLTYVAACFADTTKEASKGLEPLASPPPGPKPVFHCHCFPCSFWLLNTFVGFLFPEGRLYLADYHWVNTSIGDVVKRLKEQFKTRVDADSFVLIARYQKPPSDMFPRSDMTPPAAFSMSRKTLVGVYGIADQDSEMEENRDWLTQMRGLLDPISAGLYVGESVLEDGNAYKCYSPAAWNRLREIKKQYDPDGLFYWFLGDRSPVEQQ